MTANLSIWDELARTDPAHTKPFKRAGGFKGTAVKPIYCIQRMTEQFGPYGKGWGVEKPEHQLVNGNNGEILVYCTVELWWMDGPNRHSGFGVGGDKVVTYIKEKNYTDDYGKVTHTPERWENDDEAFKKAFTDAIGNAMKHLGMSADIHMGLFDDSKYVNDVRREIAEEKRAETTPPPPPPSGKPTNKTLPPAPETPFDEPPKKDSDEIDDWPAYVVQFKEAFLAAGGYLSAQEYWHSQTQTLAALKAARPQAYAALVSWCKAEGEKLPKEAS